MTALQRYALALPLAAGSIGWTGLSFKYLGAEFVLGSLNPFDPSWFERAELPFVAFYPLSAAVLIAAKPRLGRLALLLGALGLAALAVFMAVYPPRAPIRLIASCLIATAVGLLLARFLLERDSYTEAA